MTAMLKVNVSVKKEEENPLALADKEKMKGFTDELGAMFFEAKKYEDNPYGRLCVYHELFEIVNSNVNEFKYISGSALLFMTIRDSALRMVADLGGMALKHGNDPEFLEAITRLSNVLLSVLSKLGSA
jgi:hypothetical protein